MTADVDLLRMTASFTTLWKMTSTAEAMTATADGMKAATEEMTAAKTWMTVNGAAWILLMRELLDLFD